MQNQPSDVSVKLQTAWSVQLCLTFSPKNQNTSYVKNQHSENIILTNLQKKSSCLKFLLLFVAFWNKKEKKQNREKLLDFTKNKLICTSVTCLKKINL